MRLVLLFIRDWIAINKDYKPTYYYQARNLQGEIKDKIKEE
jgi:hypothetical protein